MPALNFKSRFADLVVTGAKIHTIRAWRKRPFKVGDPLMFYTGMRTKACRKLRANAVCTAASSIIITSGTRLVSIREGSRYTSRAGWWTLRDETVEQLARNDGFESVDAFFQFFATATDHFFCGQLIEWEAK